MGILTESMLLVLLVAMGRVAEVSTLINFLFITVSSVLLLKYKFGQVSSN